MFQPIGRTMALSIPPQFPSLPQIEYPPPSPHRHYPPPVMIPRTYDSHTLVASAQTQTLHRTPLAPCEEDLSFPQRLPPMYLLT